MITTDDIKALRDETGVSVMQCKKALEEAGGDREKAKVILRKLSGVAAAKHSERTLGSGAVGSYVHATGTIGAMTLLACETDFVAKNDEFRSLARDIAMHVAAMNPDFLRREDVGAEAMDAARAVFEKESAGKSVEIREKVISGKLDAYFAEKILLEQPFIKDETRRIRDLVTAASQKFGERVEVTRFVRVAV
ncbi:MAG: elongation factor Ts [bacterium]|nr:elongation factor Ts [bacterium]MDZ4284454.1 elongation factor Ts [Patescibacteria group bacterium]